MMYYTMSNNNWLKFFHWSLMGITLLFGVGCESNPVIFRELKVAVVMPVGTEATEKHGIDIEAFNVMTGRTLTSTTDVQGHAYFQLEEGWYRLEINTQRDVTAQVQGAESTQSYTQTIFLRATVDRVIVSEESLEVDMPLVIATKSNGFVIKELYYAGSTTPANGRYFQDQFIEIYNNSDSVLYADGLTVVEGAHISSRANAQFTEFPNCFVVGALYTIPGSGKEHPVMPGESILIASMAINHQQVNPHSPVDLSRADFEWFDAGNDVDVPEVPNLIRNFCYSNTIWVMHVRGVKAYAIFRLTGSYADFHLQHAIQVPTASGSSVVRIRIPNALILDAVELGAAGAIGSKALSPSLDLSYTYCLATYNGRSVRRKVSHWVNGRAVLVDTNNSAFDFIPNTIPKPRQVE